MSKLILPESRMKRVVDVIKVDGVNMVPIFCANCGEPKGRVPEEFITFTFALCDPCAEKYGDDANFYAEPDSDFFERVQNAQLEKAHRLLTMSEVMIELDDPSSTMSKLAEEWKRHATKAR